MLTRLLLIIFILGSFHCGGAQPAVRLTAEEQEELLHPKPINASHPLVYDAPLTIETGEPCHCVTETPH